MIDKNALLDAEIQKLDNLIVDFTNKNGYCLDEYNKDIEPHNITLEYLDSYDYEKIILEPLIFNEYGIIKYIVNIESYSLDNELELMDYFYHNEIRITENKLNQVERKTEKTRNKYLEAKPIILKSWPEKMITIENTISNRECFLNITHYHYYYSKTITLETRDFNDLLPFLKLRDFFNNIKMGDN